MLNLTKRVDYALIALTHLSLHPGERLAAREVAGVYNLPLPLLANVFKELARHGFVRSVRGAKGGYELTQDPSSIVVGRLVEALEGPVRLAECIGDEAGHDSGACCISKTCPVRRGVFRLHARIRDALYGISLADLIRDTSAPSAVAAARSTDSTRLTVIQDAPVHACAAGAQPGSGGGGAGGRSPPRNDAAPPSAQAKRPV